MNYLLTKLLWTAICVDRSVAELLKNQPRGTMITNIYFIHMCAVVGKGFMLLHFGLLQAVNRPTGESHYLDYFIGSNILNNPWNKQKRCVQNCSKYTVLRFKLNDSFGLQTVRDVHNGQFV